MTPIRTTDKQGIDGIIQTGRPAGYWMAQSKPFPRIWLGVVADGHRAVRKHGTFGEVLDWLQFKSGVLSDERRGVRREAGEQVFGIRVTWEGREWLSPDEMERAKSYAGFTCHTARGSSRNNWRQTRPVKDGLKHGSVTKEPTPVRIASRELNETILRLSREGMIQKDIAARLGVSETCVNARVRKMRKRGIEVPRVMKEKQKAGQWERAMEMKRMRDEEGLRAKEISARTGIHVNTVYMLLKIADGKEAGG